MKYSFIIPTVDRKEALARCLASIEQAYKFANGVDMEVVVVFNGRGGENRASVKVEFPEKLSIHNIDKMNVSAARNYGIEKSKGDYLIFIDDDATINRKS